MQVSTALWNYGGQIAIKLVNDDTESDEIIIEFPNIITTDASLFLSEYRTYTMQGAFDVVQEVESLKETNQSQQEEIQDIRVKMLEYITPSTQSTSQINDGSSNTILTFEFFCSVNETIISFNSCVQFNVSTTEDIPNEIFGDCTLTINFVLDSVIVKTFDQTYGDGDHVLTLNYLLQNLSSGNHVFGVVLALAGGTIS